jgi:hypothetical protein
MSITLTTTVSDDSSIPSNYNMVELPDQSLAEDEEDLPLDSDFMTIVDQKDFTKKHITVGNVSSFDMSTTFSRDERKLYFSWQFNNRQEISYLSSRSQFGQPHVAAEQLDFHEVMLQAITAQLSFYLTQSQISLLERIIIGTEKVVEMRAANHSPRSHVIELLSKVGSIMCAVVVDCDTFLNILPHLAVRLHKKDHAYCLPSDCVADLQAQHGLHSILYDPSGNTGTTSPMFGRKETAFMNQLFPQKDKMEVNVDGEVWIL